MAKDKKLKTNAMRILDSKKVSYEMLSYESEDGKIDGISVAHKIGVDEKNVFKTLVAQGTSKELYVFVIPVAEELDLKNAAKIAGEKKIEMIAVKDIMKYTGYIRGGCSPIGLKRDYRTFIHESAKGLDFMIVSAGKIGHQIKLNPNDLVEVVSGKFEDLIKQSN
ncbi:Cys-tRNA(Pro) deacylase [Clostridium perfringens]|nr:Cys-tRNA(Pro) deacylase [Clostridium perfringens]